MNLKSRKLSVLCFMLGLTVLSSGDLFAQVINKMTFTTIRNGTASKDWTTDSTQGAKFGSSVLQLVGYIPTGRTDIPFQRMLIRITGFAGKGQYDNQALSTSFFEDIFSSQLVPTQFITGSVSVTDITDSPFSVNAKFSFKFQSQPPGSNSFSTDVLNGTFKFNVVNSLVVSGDPPISDLTKPVKAVQGEKVKWKVYVKDKDGVVSAGASVYESNKALGTTDKLVGTTDATGTFQYSFTVPATLNPDTYQVRFVAKKTNYADSDPFTVNVKITTAQYYFYKCAGMPIYVFDAGQGNVWKGSTTDKLIKSTGTTTINSLLSFDGSAIIDTTDGAESFSGSGKLYLHNITLPNSAGPGDYTILNATIPPLQLSCTALFDKGLDNISTWLSKVVDMDVKITKMRFTNTDEVADGLEMSGSISGGEKQLGQCNAKTAQNGITLTGSFKITTAGLKDLSFLVTDFGMGPGACLKKCGFTYTDNPTETMKFVGSYESKVFGGLDADLTMTNKTKTDPMTFAIKIDKTLATCKPIPDTPFCLKTIGADASCSDKLELRHIGVHGLIVSDEQVLKQKFNFDIPVITQLAEMDIKGYYDAPFKLGVGGSVKLLKIPSIGGTGKEWQVEGTNDVVLDVSTNTIQVLGVSKIGQLGGTKFFFENNQTTTIDWTSGFDFSAQASGTMTLPDMNATFLQNRWVKKAVKWLSDNGVTLPSPLGTANYRLHNTSLRANIDFSANQIPAIKALGKGYMQIQFDASTPFTFLKFGSGSIALTGTKKLDDKGNGVQGILGDNDAAKSSQKFTVDNTMERVLVYVSSDNQVPASTIVDPDGKRFTTTSSDSSVTQFITSDKSLLMWVLVNPKVGQWTLELVNPAPTDSVEVNSVEKTRAFDVTAATQNRTLTVTWDGSHENNGSTVEIYLDENNGAKQGKFVGSVAATAGTFSMVLNDSLPACQYYVYATRVTASDFVTSYAPNAVSTGKVILAAPQNIVANCVDKGNTTVSWDKSIDPNTAGYFLIVRDPLSSKDSVYATLYSDELNASISIADPLNKLIFLQSFDTTGLRGCMSQARAITVGVDDERGGLTQGDPRILLIPNPTNAVTSIRFETSEEAPTSVFIFNILGQRIGELSPGVLGAGTHTVKYDCTNLTDGTYIIRIVNGNSQFSTVMSVVH